MWPREREKRERSYGDEMRFTFSSCTVCASGLPERLHRSSLNGFLLLLYSPSTALNSLAHRLCMLFHNQPQLSRWGAHARRLRHTIQHAPMPSSTRSAFWLRYLPKCTSVHHREASLWLEGGWHCHTVVTQMNGCLKSRLYLHMMSVPWVISTVIVIFVFCLNKWSVLCGAALVHFKKKNVFSVVLLA